MDSTKSSYVFCDKRGVKKRWGISWVGVDGRRRKEITVARTREQANLLLTKKIQEVVEAKVAGITVDVPDIQFEVFIKEYLRHAEANKTPRAFMSDQMNTDKLLKVFGRMKLKEIRQGLVQKYIDDRLHAKKANGQAYRPATINRELMCLSAIFREAVKREYVPINPVRGISQLKENNKIVRYLSDEEETELLKACTPTLLVIVRFALASGMRKGEILGLLWKDVDFEQELIKVEQTKTHSKRYLPMNETLIELLKSVPRFEGCNHVFANESGQPYVKIDDIWFRALKRAKLHIRFHDLRHTFASRLVQQGVEIQVVQELLGHKTLAVTQRYAHLSPKNLRDAMRFMDKPKQESDSTHPK